MRKGIISTEWRSAAAMCEMCAVAAGTITLLPHNPDIGTSPYLIDRLRLWTRLFTSSHYQCSTYMQRVVRQTKYRRIYFLLFTDLSQASNASPIQILCWILMRALCKTCPIAYRVRTDIMQARASVSRLLQSEHFWQACEMYSDQ